MLCPSCGAEVPDPHAIFCSRCGAPIAAAEAEATIPLEVPPTEAEPTASFDRPEPEHEHEHEVEASPPAPRAGSSLLGDFAGALRHRFVATWLDPLAAACLAFLIVLVLGSLLLIAAKLQYPGFGAGANPVEVLSAISILGLASLRVPVHLEDVVISVLPVGMLLAAGAGIAWATSATLRDAGRSRAFAGAFVGIPFAGICWLAALVFRFGGRNEVFAGAWGALLWGLVWGSAFGSVGSYSKGRGPRAVARDLFRKSESAPIRRGAAAGLVALGTAAALGVAAMLLWVIVGLIKGAPGPGFGLGDAAAAFIYLVAFAPNVVVIVTALGMGAPVYVGARVTVAGSAVGRVTRVWLFGDPPGYLPLLILIPAVACVLAGFWARRASDRSDMVPVIVTQAVVFGVVVAVLAWLGEARLGAALLGRGLARVDVNAFATLVLGLLWGAVGGYAGWLLADRRKGESS